MEPNIKTYADLLKDTENTWDLDESLEELLFDCDSLLEDTIRRSYQRPIVKGDIIMANNGKSQRERGMDITSPHRIFIIEDSEGDLGNRIFKGYLLSSQVRKANYYNSKYPNNIYIDNYGTIIERGPQTHCEAFINLSDLYVIQENQMDPEASSLWKGRVTPEFINFIDSAVESLNKGESIAHYHWMSEDPANKES
jgi:hypothetical protein